MGSASSGPPFGLLDLPVAIRDRRLHESPVFGLDEVDEAFFFPPQRASAAFCAISFLRFAVKVTALAGPPFLPIIENTRLTISGVGSACTFFLGISAHCIQNGQAALDRLMSL